MDEFWKVFANNLLMAFAPVLAGLLAALIISWVRLLWARVAAEKPQLAEVLHQAATLAVMAAEQSGMSGYVADKKRYAIDYLQNYLISQGWGAINIELIEGAIEAAVLEQFNSDKVDKPEEAVGFIKE